jgi:dihydrofolate reductase
MRELKLQMQISIDGFVTANNGGTNFNWDNEVRSYCIKNLTDVDCILIGRKTAESIIDYWAGVASNPENPDYEWESE